MREACGWASNAPLPVIIHREEVWREIARLRDQAELEEITRRAY